MQLSIVSATIIDFSKFRDKLGRNILIVCMHFFGHSVPYFQENSGNVKECITNEDTNITTDVSKQGINRERFNFPYFSVF